MFKILNGFFRSNTGKFTTSYVLPVVFIIILMSFGLKKLKAYNLNKRAEQGRKKDYNIKQLRYTDEHYISMALRTFNILDGWTDSISDKQKLYGDLLELNNDELIFVYNEFNSTYAKSPETLRSWINDEWYSQTIFNDNKTPLIARMDSIGLA